MARTRKDTKLTIFSFENLRIPATDDGVDIELHLAESVRRLVAVLTSLLKASKSLRTKAMGVMRIGEDRASGVVDVPQAGVPGLVGAIESMATTIKAGFDDVTNRYQEAMRANQAIRRTTFDKQIIKLNALAWGAKHQGCELMMFPLEAYGWRFDPVDPQTLECEVPKEWTEHVIENARVLGAYENVPDTQQDLFAEDQVEWILVIDHKVRQIRYHTTRSKGQVINRGITYLTVKVEGVVGDIPDVVGDLEIKRAREWMAED